MAARIRPYQADDLPSLYSVCVQTGDRGEDLTPKFRDPSLLGAIYAAPYGVYAPERCFVVEDEIGVAGYVVGAHDTAAFDAWMIREWLAPLRERHPRPQGAREGWDADQRVIADIHNYGPTPDAITAGFPAHLHLNVLPRLQRRKWGTRLCACWIDDARSAGIRSAHIGVASGNERGLAFWRSAGFRPIPGLAGAEGPDNVFLSLDL